MAATTLCSDFGSPQNKVWHCFHCLPIYFPWGDGTRCNDLSFLNVKLWANFFTLLFHFHQEAFQFLFTLCHKGIVICLSEVIDIPPAVSIPACASSSQGFLMMYSAYKLNKQGDNIQPWCTPFPIWNKSVVPHPVLTVASWPAHRFLEASQVVWYFHLFQNFPVYVIHTVEGFGVVNKAEIVFLELSCFFNEIKNMSDIRKVALCQNHKAFEFKLWS